jgi:hypothetical protein
MARAAEAASELDAHAIAVTADRIPILLSQWHRGTML